MNSKQFAVALSALALAMPAYGAARIDAVSVNPATSTAGTPVSIRLTINRPTPLDLAPCDLAVDPGDGAAPVTVGFDPVDGRNKQISHTYKKSGSYKLTVKGTGKHPCAGERSTQVQVGGSGSVAAPKPACPEGWTMASKDGAKYTCRANPPARALLCEGGTKYFTENGAIGCR